MAVPAFHEIFNPLLQAMRNLGGSATNQELVDEVARILSLSTTDLAISHSRGRYTLFEYRSAWARSYLKSFGLFENSERGVWTFTETGEHTEKVNAKEVQRLVRSKFKKKKQSNTEREEISESDEEELDQDWRGELITILQNLEPSAFERLCQRVLRESGFIRVEVTGRSNDGGIDGVGKVQIGGLLSFPIIFQCKRYSGSVGPSIVRDFRGSMVGRADRGLILTTGTFTSEARKEASRDGAPPIDLVDGESLMNKLKDLGLGVKVEKIEQVEVDEKWFIAV